MNFNLLAVALAATIFSFNADAKDASTNAFGITYEMPNLPEGVVRAASWRSHDIALTPKNSAALISLPSASFVKVYFDQVYLPAGWQLEVANVDGSEAYRYTNAAPDGAGVDAQGFGIEGADFTTDIAMGQNGRTSFAAMSISGDFAQVRLIAPTSDASGRRYSEQPSVIVSHVLEGYPDQVMIDLKSTNLLLGGTDPVPNSICGTDNKQRPACYSGTAFTRSKAVARLLIGGGGSCTAWRIGANDKMLTNNHCISSTSSTAASEVWFNYQHSGCAGAGTSTTTKVSGKAMLKTSGPLDYTLFTINNSADVASFGTLSIDPRMPNPNEQIYIPQHPGGRLKELAVNSTTDSTGKCKVLATQVGNDFSYFCDTEPGSSGSPVLSSSNNKVIGLHHLGGCGNQAVRISRVWQEIGSLFNNQVP